MVEMKGTEKQVAWANDIRERVVKLQNWMVENVTDLKVSKKYPESKETVFNKINEVLQNDQAKFWIENFGDVRSTDNLADVFAYLNGLHKVIETENSGERFVMSQLDRKAPRAWAVQN